MPEQSLVPLQRIESAILVPRGRKVMLDADLAAMYGAKTKVVVRAVKPNRYVLFASVRSDGIGAGNRTFANLRLKPRTALDMRAMGRLASGFA